MRYFVEKERLRPDLARAEIRRINDEVFKLVIELSVATLSAGAGFSSIGNSLRSTGNAMRGSASRVVKTAEKTKFASPESEATVEEIKLSQQEYRAALGRVFPSHQLDPVARTVDEIGQRAAKRVANNPDFLKALTKGGAEGMRDAGNMFHDAAKHEARALPAGSLPPGWKLTAEETIKSGKGGGRLDLFLRGPNRERVELDWKPRGSGYYPQVSGAKQMAKHAGHIVVHEGVTVTSQQSRSWVDYVRPYFPSIFR